MTRHRTIFLTLFLPVALVVVPSSALAGSLLSGYGAPGGGAQAILGARLLNGGGGGSSGGGSSTTSGGGSVATGQAGGRGAAGQGQGMTGQGAGALSSSRRGVGAAKGKGSTGRAGSPGASTQGSSAYTYSGSPQPAVGLASADSGPLGFTGADLLLLVLVLGVLAITARLTRRLARMQH